MVLTVFIDSFTLGPVPPFIGSAGSSFSLATTAHICRLCHLSVCVGWVRLVKIISRSPLLFGSVRIHEEPLFPPDLNRGVDRLVGKQ